MVYAPETLARIFIKLCHVFQSDTYSRIGIDGVALQYFSEISIITFERFSAASKRMQCYNHRYGQICVGFNEICAAEKVWRHR